MSGIARSIHSCDEAGASIASERREPEALPVERNQRLAFEAIRPEAAAVPPEALQNCPSKRIVDITLNALDTASFVDAEGSAALGSVPADQRPDATRLRVLAAALPFVFSLLAQVRAGKSGYDALLSDVIADREALHLQIRLAEHFGLVPSETVRTIERGGGNRDFAQDVIDYSHLMRTTPRLTDASLIKEPWLDAAEVRANSLLAQTTPNGRRRVTPSTPEAIAEAEHLEDAVYTLLVQEHAKAERYADARYGRREGGRKVKSLLARRRPRRRKKDEAPAETSAQA